MITGELKNKIDNSKSAPKKNNKKSSVKKTSAQKNIKKVVKFLI